MIKRASVLVGTLIVTLLLSACARGPARTDNDTHRETLAQNEKKPVSTEVVRNGQGNPRRVLITYFTYPDNTDAQAIHSKEYDVMASASLNVKDGQIIGNDAMIANEIARETGGDVFSILAEKPYSADYDAMIRDEKAAPRNEKRELKSHVGDMSGYDTVVLVYPIWWDALPAPVTAFLTENDFSGKALYAVASSGDSDFVDTVEDIAELEPDANVYEGCVLRHDEMDETSDAVRQWLRTANFMK